MTNKSELIEKLKEFKKRNGINTATLAVLLGVVESQVSKWFNGHSLPSDRNADKIKLLLNEHAIISNEIKKGSYVKCEFLGFKNVCGTVKKLLNNMLFIEFDKQHLGTMSIADYESFNCCGAVAYDKAIPVVKEA